MSEHSHREPFDLPTGCDPISVPPISVVDLCSMPAVTSPGVSPVPVMFDVPDIPNVEVEQACVNIVPAFTARMGVIQGEQSSRLPSGGFRTETGFDDCFDGRYRMSVMLSIPCVLKAIPSKVSGTGAWVGRNKSSPRGELLFKRKDDRSCDFRTVSMRIEVPCPVDGTHTGLIENDYYGKPPKSGVVGRMVLFKDGNKCEPKLSVHIKIPPCGGVSMKGTAAATSFDSSSPSVHVTFVRGDESSMSGTKPEACEFEMQMSLWLPEGCNAATYSIHPTLRAMNPASGPTAYGSMRKSDASGAGGCQFSMGLNLYLGTAALNPCPGISRDTDKDEEYAEEDTEAGDIEIGFTKPPNSKNCDLQYEMAIELPKVIVDPPDVTINMGDIGVDIDNGGPIGPLNPGGAGNLPNNHRKFSIDVKLPPFQCSPDKVYSVSMVNMKFFKDAGLEKSPFKLTRHVSGGCVTKLIRKSAWSFTMGCVTQCSRTESLHMMLPWWVYRADTYPNGSGAVTYRAYGNRDAGKASMKISLRDGSDGEADAGMWLELENPANFLTFTSKTLVITPTPENRGVKYSLEMNTQALPGLNGNFTRVTDMGFSAGGLAQRYVVEKYKNGMLVSRSNAAWKSVFSVTKCE